MHCGRKNNMNNPNWSTAYCNWSTAYCHLNCTPTENILLIKSDYSVLKVNSNFKIFFIASMIMSYVNCLLS